MDRTFAKDVIEFGRSGRTYTRTDLMQREGQMAINAVLPLREFQARCLAPDVALVTCPSETAGGRSQTGPSTWTRMAGAWRLRFHQGTPISD